MLKLSGFIRPLLAACMAAMVCSGFAAAQGRSDYPSKTIRWIVPFPPGGGSDFTARLLSTRMADFVGEHSIVVENKPGGLTVIGTQIVASAVPDGHTIGMAMDSIVANQYLLKSVPYKYEDFVPVKLIYMAPLLFIVKPDASVHSMQEAIQWMKRNDGKLTYGTWGTGSTAHFAGETLGEKLGVKLVQVPYAGAAPSVQAMLGGQLDILIAPANVALPYIRAGKFKVLGVLSKSRVAQLPEIPTSEELLGTEFDFNSWVGVIAPKGTPAAVVHKLSDAMSIALKHPEVVKTYTDRGDVVLDTTPAQFKALIESDAKKIESIVRSRKLTLE